MPKEYKNPYEKHMKSSKKRFVATTPAGKVYQADTQDEMTKLLKDNGFIKEKKPKGSPSEVIINHLPEEEKPQYDPNTGERIN